MEHKTSVIKVQLHTLNSIIMRSWIKKTFETWREETLKTFKDSGLILFFFVVPLLYPLAYSWIYNNETVNEVSVAVVDMSHSKESRDFIRQYDSSPDVQVSYNCNTLDEAKQLMGMQKIKGIIYIPANFNSDINRFKQAHISLFCDMSMMLVYKAIYKTSIDVSSKINAKIQVKLAQNHTNKEDEITEKPLEVDEIALFNPTSGYGSSLIPAVLILIIQQTMLLGMGMAAGTRREYIRMRKQSDFDHRTNVTSIIFGKVLCYMILYTIIAAYLTLVVPSVFQFLATGSLKTWSFIIFPYLLACTLFGILFSFIVRYREDIMLLVVFMSIPLLFLSGVSWPKSSIPQFWTAFSYLFPSTFGIQGFVKLNSMGADIPQLKQEFVALLIQSFVYFVLIYFVLKSKIKRGKK